MNIELFNFLEDNLSRIEQLTVDECLRNRDNYSALSRSELEKSSKLLADGYIDLLVTGMSDELEKLFRFLSRIMVRTGVYHSEIVGMPLILSTVIRRLLAEEYGEGNDPEKAEDFFEMVDITRSVGHDATFRFVKIFDEYLQKKSEIDDYSS